MHSGLQKDNKVTVVLERKVDGANLVVLTELDDLTRKIVSMMMQYQNHLNVPGSRLGGGRSARGFPVHLPQTLAKAHVVVDTMNDLIRRVITPSSRVWSDSMCLRASELTRMLSSPSVPLSLIVRVAASAVVAMRENLNFGARQKA
jgi:hypothetical protein